jgi:hypothetical protein
MEFLSLAMSFSMIVVVPTASSVVYRVNIETVKPVNESV